MMVQRVPVAGGLRFRPAVVEDGPFLLEMLLCAVNWDDGRPPRNRDAVLAAPELAHYVDGWPRPGDAGVVAVDETGQPVGAAWLRRFTAEDPSYGYVDDETPELSVGVSPGHRGRGVGTALCREVLRSADAAGVPGVSLSVEKANPATALYGRLGFVAARDDGDSVTMVRTRGNVPAA